MMQFKLSDANSSSDQLAIAGPLTKGTVGTFQFDFQGMGHPGTTYTVATFASTTFSVSDFSYSNLGFGLTGTFMIVGGDPSSNSSVNPILSDDREWSQRGFQCHSSARNSSVRNLPMDD